MVCSPFSVIHKCQNIAPRRIISSVGTYGDILTRLFDFLIEWVNVFWRVNTIIVQDIYTRLEFLSYLMTFIVTGVFYTFLPSFPKIIYRCSFRNNVCSINMNRMWNETFSIHWGLRLSIDILSVNPTFDSRLFTKLI